MNLNLKNKTAVVCGSTQGIGLASALELASFGANIVLMARNEASLQKVVQTLDSSLGQKHSYLVADFKSSNAVSEAISGYVKDGGRADILINNTGGPAAGNIEQATNEHFLSAFESHLLCNQVLAQALVPGMKLNKWGRIINIISTSVKSPLPGLGVSNTIRAAVASWAKTLATELAADGITVNNVLPGFTATARASTLVEDKAHKLGTSRHEILAKMVKEIPVGRMATPLEIGCAVAFLASPSAAYITGINLPVDGGRLTCL